MTAFATTSPVTATANIPAGTVHFTATDRTDTIVEILPADASKSRDVKAAEQTTAEYAGGVLRIAGMTKNQYFGPTGSVRVTVQLPSASRVEVKAASVELRADGRYEEVVVDSDHGDITVDEAAAAKLTTVAGNVSVGRLTGSAELRTSKGDITVAEAVRGTVVMRTDAGDIKAGAAKGSAASLDAGTTHGRISNALTSPAGATDVVALHATTSSGDISAHTV